MLITSDIPVNIRFSEFIRAECGMVIILCLHAFLVIKGTIALNILNLIVPNGLWVINFMGDREYHYHAYATILSTSMIGCMLAILIANLAAIILRKNSNWLE
jgi:hypothetical protein